MLLFIGQIMLLFSIYIFSVRLLGKSAIAQLTAHDFGAIFFLAYLLFGSLEVDGVTQGLVGVLVVILLYLVISKLTLINKLNKYLAGESTYLIKNGKVMKRNLKRSRFTLSELLSSIRTAGYFDLSDVDFALLEPNGEISILPKRDKGFLTPSHLNISVEDRGLPIIVIMEGIIQHQHLDLIDQDDDWLKDQLQKLGYEDISNIFLATVKSKDLTLEVYLEN
ncbi:DUF421 domain-containing protein [Aquisalibacillus elongatus]|uniref:Uncharacterized membrane protein YcaP (DUF421 family) n=1 Tax=Aquisalibacillus elongatus TaxID=485577 RepID=A0A3N5BDU0_9BACI|nr:DUF421 domain-containing protein [Aquisalibacillus elongatus]RPF55864.1 uncharacterized membrane protein YcaP (DUF421 family) [Aquisalibacillus elongatus]